MPPRNGVGLDDDKTTCPRWPRLAERHPEGPIDVHERWARALLFKSRHLLSQREVFQYEVGAAATHCPDGTGTERDDEDKNLEHRGRSVPVPWRDLNCGAEYAYEPTRPRNCLISRADEF